MGSARRHAPVSACTRGSARWFSAIAAVLALSAPALVPCAVRADSALEELLAAGIERPAYLGQFKHPSSAEVRALIAIHQRVAAPRHVRLRALSALAESDHSEAQAFLRGLVREANAAPHTDDALHPSRSVPVLSRALKGLRMAPGSVPPASLAFCLGHAHPAIRQAAVVLLSAQGTPAAASLLARQRSTEQSPRVRRALAAAP